MSFSPGLVLVSHGSNPEDEDSPSGRSSDGASTAPRRMTRATREQSQPCREPRTPPRGRESRPRPAAVSRGVVRPVAPGHVQRGRRAPAPTRVPVYDAMTGIGESSCSRPVDFGRARRVLWKLAEGGSGAGRVRSPRRPEVAWFYDATDARRLSSSRGKPPREAPAAFSVPLARRDRRRSRTLRGKARGYTSSSSTSRGRVMGRRFPDPRRRGPTPGPARHSPRRVRLPRSAHAHLVTPLRGCPTEDAARLRSPSMTVGPGGRKKEPVGGGRGASRRGSPSTRRVRGQLHQPAPSRLAW